jgi:hypothetical protein
MSLTDRHSEYEAFAAIYNDLERYPTLGHVYEALGRAGSTVRHTAARIRQLHQRQPELYPALVSRTERLMPFQHQSEGATPLSEEDAKYREDFTAQDCIDTLRDFALKHPELEVTRHYFRLHGPISEATWNRYFGTWNEFTRQAGIKLTRQQHALERAIAKHASVDHYRRLNDERGDYGERYLRPSGARFKTRIFASDLHDEEMDPFFRRVLIDTIARVRPDSFTVVGDGLDLPEFGKYSVDPREWGPVRRIKALHGFFEDVRAVYDGQLDYIEGNHEYRLLRHLGDETPALKTVLAELHGMTIRQLLGLDRFEINYIAKADLATFRERDVAEQIGRNYKVYDGCFLAHHFPEGRQMNMPGCNGHHHRHVVWSHFNPQFGAYEWHQMGCGHKREASYCAGEKWHTGFLLAHIDTETRQVVHEYVQLTDFAWVGGKFYRRAPGEADHATS